ncbi:MAG: hypothetical protein PHV63_02960 [Candidatus Daviesbacteria bacterium]|nr:hypothetical protein [Candidatus Daviesbacteria bacterium]
MTSNPSQEFPPRTSAITHPSERPNLTQEDFSRLHENGGTREGIIVFEFIPHPDPSTINEGHTSSKNIDGFQYHVGEKLEVTEHRLTAHSLFYSMKSDSKAPPWDWPCFIYGPNTVTALLGLHLNDLRGYSIEPAIPPLDSFPTGIHVNTVGFQVIDFLRVKQVLPGRIITVETTLVERKEERERTLRVAEDWQQRLQEVTPFMFRSWNEVLDVIEEK